MCALNVIQRSLVCVSFYRLQSLTDFRRLRTIATAAYYLRHFPPPFRPSLCLSACINVASTEWITANMMSRKSKFRLNRTKISVSLHEDVISFIVAGVINSP